MPEFKIHTRLPSGFALANEQQAANFVRHGFVHGAGKVCFVQGPGATEPTLAVRLQPPATLARVQSELGRNAVGSAEHYVREYNAGRAAAGRAYSDAWDSGMTSHAWDDGYLDRAAGRAKWHLTYCLNHDACGEG